MTVLIDGFLFGVGFAIGIGAFYGVILLVLLGLDRLNPDLFIAE